MHKVFLAALFSFIFLVTARGQAKTTVPLRKTIICLTYDDGLESQLTTVIPQLDSFGLKATFFLNSIQGSSSSEVIGHTPEAVLGWTNAAKNGHELANHTLFHPCPEKIGWDKAVALENYTVGRIITEIKTQNAILALLDPHRKGRSFAFPCGNYLVGDTDYISIIKKQGLITYARGEETVPVLLPTLNTSIPSKCRRGMCGREQRCPS